MINRAAYQDLTEVGMPAAQAQAVAAHIPDWSQFATKDDLRQLESRLGQSMSQMDTRMSQMEVRLVRALAITFLTFLVLLGGQVALALNPTAVARALYNFLQNF